MLYGDVRDFPTDDKRRVLAALKAEAERYANFRFQDWTAAPFGALATPDMVPVFLELLAEPSRSEADLALLDCALDALRHGPPLAELGTDTTRFEALLDAAARDASYPEHIRHSALKILLRDLPRNATRLVAIARGVQAGIVEDKDDQLLDRLLTELFPEFIRPAEVFDFLHQEKQDRLIGDYRMFWGHHLPESAQAETLPELDELAQRSPTLRKSLDGYQADRMEGGLLARALETYGDTIDDARLYDWLGAGLDDTTNRALMTSTRSMSPPGLRRGGTLQGHAACRRRTLHRQGKYGRVCFIVHPACTAQSHRTTSSPGIWNGRRPKRTANSSTSILRRRQGS